MGRFCGVAPFLDPTLGSVNVMGVAAGVLLYAMMGARG